MFRRLLRSARPDRGIAQALYGASVAQARKPAFYRDFGVPDTVAGRFEMILLHAVLLFRRLEASGERGLALRQELFDTFFQDMDRSLREMGVGDLSVPRRIRKMAESAYGRLAAYGVGLEAGEPALAEALARNVFAGVTAPAGALPLAAYMRRAEAHLAGSGGSALAEGAVTWPEPMARPAPVDVVP
jgi:cytochrome b pre-mRNA-processing protein 3